MSQEIIYTSAPQGLKVGSRGFCTVASSSGMAKPLADYLESLSGYRHVYPPGDSNASLNPVCYSHLTIKVAGQRYHILSRIADAGLDYSQRTNKLAHHVALSTTELVEAGPAWILSQPGFMETAWSGEPRLLPGGRRPPQGNATSVICNTWKQLTGDAGWGGVLAETIASSASGEAYLIYRPGMDLLPLLLESQLLLPSNLRWQATFSTYFTKLPPGAQCRWKCVLAETPEAIAAQRARGPLVLDLTNSLGPAPDSPWAEAARRGITPQQSVSSPAQGSSVVETLDLAPEPISATKRPSLEPPLELAATPPSLKAARGTQDQGSEEDLFNLSFRPARPRGANALGTKPKNKWLKYTLLSLLMLVVSVAAAGTWYWYDDQDEPIAKSLEHTEVNQDANKQEELVSKLPKETRITGKSEKNKEIEETTKKNFPAEKLNDKNSASGKPKESSELEIPSQANEVKSNELEEELTANENSQANSNKHPPDIEKAPLRKVSPYLELDKNQIIIASEISPDDVKELRLLGDKYELQSFVKKGQESWEIVRKEVAGGSRLGGNKPVAQIEFKSNSLNLEWAEKESVKTQPELKYHVLLITFIDQQLALIPFSDQQCNSLHVTARANAKVHCIFPICDSYKISNLRITGAGDVPFTEFFQASEGMPFHVDSGPDRRVQISVRLIAPTSGIDGMLESEVSVLKTNEGYRPFPKLSRLDELAEQEEYNNIKNSIKKKEADLEKAKADGDGMLIKKLENDINSMSSSLNKYKTNFFSGFHQNWPNIEELAVFEKLLESVRLNFVVLGRMKLSDNSEEFVDFPILVVGDRPKDMLQPRSK